MNATLPTLTPSAGALVLSYLDALCAAERAIMGGSALERMICASLVKSRRSAAIVALSRSGIDLDLCSALIAPLSRDIREDLRHD